MVPPMGKVWADYWAEQLGKSVGYNKRAEGIRRILCGYARILVNGIEQRSRPEADSAGVVYHVEID